MTLAFTITLTAEERQARKCLVKQLDEARAHQADMFTLADLKGDIEGIDRQACEGARADYQERVRR